MGVLAPSVVADFQDPPAFVVVAVPPENRWDPAAFSELVAEVDEEEIRGVATGCLGRWYCHLGNGNKPPLPKFRLEADATPGLGRLLRELADRFEHDPQPGVVLRILLLKSIDFAGNIFVQG